MSRSLSVPVAESAKIDTAQALRARSRTQRLISHDIAIDLGTANTLVSIEGHGIIINEPSIVATHRKTKRVLAIGTEAKKMVGRTPKSIITAQPLIDGVVSDFEITEYMLKSFIQRLHREHRVLLQRPRMIVGLPCGVTEVEKRAVEEAARSAGARKIYLIEEPVAAAIGAGLDITGESGVMIVDIGGGTTEIAVLAGGNVVVAKSLRIAGDEISETITQFMRDEYNMQIGERTAEDIKTRIGAVYKHSDVKTMPVRGRNYITGLPQEIELSSDVLTKPLSKQVRPILDSVKMILEETPAELIADIMQKGIYVAGGGGLIGGIDHLIRQESQIEVVVPKNALTAVVEGASIALSQPDRYKDVLMAGE